MTIDSSAAPRMEFLLRRLMLLAGELRDSLAAGDWEQAAPLHDEYDEAFATFRHMVDAGQTISPSLTNDLTRLARVHEENEQLARGLRDQAGTERGKVRTISRIGAYAPLGGNEPGIASRYVDGSA